MRKFIGRGTFTRAYQISDEPGDEQVEVITSCPTKECYAMFSQGNRFAPKVKRNWDKENAYFMPLYCKIKSPKKQLNARSYEVYKLLRNIQITYLQRGYHSFISEVSSCEDLTEVEKESIIDLAGDVCNNMDCASMRFEISPRNISCDEQGNLVMLDCFFSAQHLYNTKGK